MPGLGARLAFEKMQPKKTRCERCGLQYPEKMARCRWCGDLDEAGLQKLLAKKEKQARANASLGRLFLLAACVLGILVLFI